MLRKDKSKQKRQIALNIQTTGYEASKGDMITEIAAIEYIDGQLTGNDYVTLVNTEGRKIDPGAVKCNKITNKMLEDAPTFYDVASVVLDFIKNDELIVHNAIYVTTFFDTLMNVRREQAIERKADLLNAKMEIERDIEAVLEENSENLNASDESDLEDLDPELKKYEDELAECMDDLAECEEIANTEWTTLCADRDVMDVMEMHQKVYPRREGYSHKLNDICMQYDIDASIDHTAANRAMLAMAAYQMLYPEYMKKKEQEKHAASVKSNINRHTMFGGKRNASTMNTADADLVSHKKASNR